MVRPHACCTVCSQSQFNDLLLCSVQQQKSSPSSLLRRPNFVPIAWFHFKVFKNFLKMPNQVLHFLERKRVAAAAGAAAVSQRPSTGQTQWSEMTIGFQWSKSLFSFLLLLLPICCFSTSIDQICCFILLHTSGCSTVGTRRATSLSATYTSIFSSRRPLRLNGIDF